MAFNINNWVRVSTSAAEPTQVLQDGTTKIGGPRMYTYITADSQATVAASGYFGNSLDQKVSGDIVTGDIVVVNSTSDNTVVWYVLTNSHSYTDIAYGGTITSTAFSNSSSSGSSNFAAVPLTAANVNGMYAAPQALLPAPGAGQMIVVERILLNAIFGSAAFTNGGVIIAQYGNTANGAGTNSCTATVAATFLTTFAANQNAAATGFTAVTTSANAVNQGLYLSNQTAAFATGTGCSLVANVWYKIVAAS